MKRAKVTLILFSLVWAATAHAETSVYLNRTRVKNPTPPQESPLFSAQWRLNFIGEDRKDETTQEKTVQTRLDFKTRYNLTDRLYLAFDPSVRFESGQSQSYDGADKPENKLLMNEASANYFPADYFSVSGGALYQRTSHSTLLMDHLAFPAARISVGPQKGAAKAYAFVESAIPTSTSLSANTKELEKTPGLDTLGVQAHWTSGNRVKLLALASYFQFRDLPSAVAMDSQLLGNSVNKVSDASYIFNQDYSGYEAVLNVSYLLTPRLRMKLEAEYLINTAAPSDVNSAYLAGGGLEYLFSASVIVEVKSLYYQVAPESAVAYFNAGGFETNRVGYKTEGFLNFRKQNFRVGVRYNESEVIFMNNYQSKETMVTLLLETFYADI